MKIIVLILCIIIALTGCIAENAQSSSTPNDSSQTNDAGESEVSYDIFVDKSREDNYNRLFSLADNETGYKQLITKTISSEEFMNSFFYRFYLPFASYNPTLDMIDEKYQVECLRNMTGDSKYSVYQADDGGLFYVFYRNRAIKSHCAYISKTLDIDAFKSISSGANVSEVMAIDPSVTEKWTAADFSKDPDVAMSFHLLKDGLLVFEYEKNDSGEYCVKTKNVYKDFIFTAAMFTTEMVDYDFTILPQDYPQ